MISIKVPDELKKKMKKFPHINWSEIARNAIIERIKIEENILKENLDLDLLKEAIEIQDNIRSKTAISKEWSSTEEIRKWRETRK
ncbi:MAG: VapB-type antitoxin [Promethearchaeota archaeon]|nr:MAG: VapB-type antitoxin [Candidatus Lokiarchaeota archaeon]